MGRRASRWRRALALLATPPAARAQSDIAKTVHNLTPEGPGKQKETVKTGLCVFCHTPHNGNPGARAVEQGAPRHQLPALHQHHDARRPEAADGKLAPVPVVPRRVRRDGQPAGAAARRRAEARRADGADGARHRPFRRPPDFVRLRQLRSRRSTRGSSIPAACRRRCRSTAPSRCSARPATTRTRAIAESSCGWTIPAGAMCLVCHDPVGWKLSSHAISPATWKGGGINPFPAGRRAHGGGQRLQQLPSRRIRRRTPERLLARTQEPDNCNVCHDGSVDAEEHRGRVQRRRQVLAPSDRSRRSGRTTRSRTRRA